jgi:hypothetical protein
MGADLINALKNKESRRKFAEGYKEWGIWFRINELGEVYHRYILPDGALLVVMEHDMRDREDYKEIKIKRGTTLYYSKHPEFFKREIISENKLDEILLEIKRKIEKGELQA